MNALLYKVIKSFAHASAVGGITAGAAVINLVDADVYTTIYMVLAAILYNAVREYIKLAQK